MTTIQITCDNCGARYKLPQTFKSPKAKCQKCGSVIDVASQRAAAEGGDAAPAAGKPAAGKPAAAARPAVDRSKSKPARAPAKAAAGKAGSRSSRRAKSVDDIEHHAEHRPGRGASSASKTPMIFGGIGLVAVIIVIAMMMQGNGNEDANTENTAQNPAANQTDSSDTDKPAENTGADKPAENTDADKPAEATDTKPAEGDQPDKPAEGDPAAKPAEASAKTPELPTNAPRWMRLKVASLDQVDTEFAEVPWDRLSADHKDEYRTLAANYAAGGRPGIDAEKTLKENPYEAMFGLIDYLRELNHLDAFEMSQAYPINRFMTELTYGLSPGFVPIEMDETIDPRKAQWNCMTTRAWLKFFRDHPDEATFKKKNAERRKKQMSGK